MIDLLEIANQQADQADARTEEIEALARAIGTDTFDGDSDDVLAKCQEFGIEVTDLHARAEFYTVRAGKLAEYRAATDARATLNTTEREARESLARLEAEQQRHNAVVANIGPQRAQAEYIIGNAEQAKGWLLANLPAHLKAEQDKLVGQKRPHALGIRPLEEQARDLGSDIARAQGRLVAAERALQAWEKMHLSLRVSDAAVARGKALAEDVNKARVACDRLQGRLDQVNANLDHARAEVANIDAAIASIHSVALEG